MADGYSTPHELTLSILGEQFLVHLPADSDAARRRRLIDAWARCHADIDPSTATTIDCRPGFDTDDGDQLETLWRNLGDRVATSVTTETLKNVTGRYALFHAAGIADKDGRVMVMCAAPGTGKTTASAVLGKHFGYVSDETIAVDVETNRVLPYPKPLQVIVADSGSRKELVNPDDLGLLHPAEPLHLSGIFILSREREPDEDFVPSIDPLPLTDALEYLVPQTSSLYLLDRPLQTLCSMAARSGGPFIIRYAEAESLPDLLTDWLESYPDAPAQESWHALPATGVDEEAERGEHYQRLAATDALEVEGGIALLLNRELFVLTGIGASIWEAAAEPVAFDELLASLEQTHGTHEDAPDLLQQALNELLSRGIISKVATS